MKTNRYAAGAALVAAGLLTGCGGGGNGGGTSHAALSASATTPQGLTATFSEDRAAVAVGGSVTYTFTLTNDTSQSITCQKIAGCGTLAGDVGGNVTIQDATGKSLYPSGGSNCGLITLGTVTLAPGQSVSEAVSFTPDGNKLGPDPFTAAGPYHATARFSVLAPDGNPDTADPTQVGPLTVNVR